METVGEKVASWAAFIVAATAAMALYFNSPDWWAPAAGLAGAAAILVFVAGRRLPGPYCLLRNTIVIGLAGFAVSLVIFAAVWNGYGDLVKLIIGLASIAVAIASIIFYRKYVRAMFQRGDVAPAPTPAALHGRFPRTPPLDDPQAVAFYPDPGKLGMLAAFQVVALLAVIVGTVLLVKSGGWPQQFALYFGLFLLAPTLSWATVCSVRRLTRRTPTVVLTKEGIYDGGTVWWTGLGIILWEEITGFYCSGRGHGGSGFSRRFLIIMLADPKVVRARQGPLQRLLLPLVSLESPSPVAIPEQLLPMTAEELAGEVERFAKRVHPELVADEAAEGGANHPAGIQ